MQDFITSNEQNIDALEFKSHLGINSQSVNSFSGTFSIFLSRFHFPFQLFLFPPFKTTKQTSESSFLSLQLQHSPIAQIRLAFHTTDLVTLRKVLMTRDFPCKNPLPDLPYSLQNYKTQHHCHHREPPKMQSRHRSRCPKMIHHDLLALENVFF